MLTPSLKIETVLSGDAEMARVDLPERPRPGSAGSKDVCALSSDDAQPRSGGRWWKFLLFLLVLAAFLPSLLTVSGQSHTVLKKLHPSLAKAVEYRSLTLHWWAPVEVQNVLIRDLSTTTPDVKRTVESDRTVRPAAKRTSMIDNDEPPLPLAEIKSIRSAEPLWQIILQGGRGIHINLQEPRLKLDVDADGSNVEKTVASVFGQSQDAASDTAFPLTAKVTDGQVLIASTRTLVTGISGEIVSGSGKTILPNLRLTAQVQDLSQPEVAARYSRSPSDRKNEQISGRESLPESSTIEEATQSTRIAANLRELASDMPALPLDSQRLTPERDFQGRIPDSLQTGAKNAVPPVDSTEDSSAEENADVRISIAAVPERSGRQTVRVAAKELHLRLIAPILSSLTQDFQCDGIVSCDLEAELVGRTISDGVVGRIRFDSDQLRVRSRNWAEGEWLSPGRTRISGAVAMAQDGFLLNQFQLHSEIAEASGEGEIQFAPSSAASEKPSDDTSAPTTSDYTSSSEVKLQGSVDVAKIVAMIPVTLQIHKDVSLTSGQVSFSFQGGKNLSAVTESGGSSPTDKPRWKGTIQTENVQAVRAGQPLRIDSDVRVSGTGPFRNGSPTVSTLSLKAGFGQIDCRPQDGGYLLSGTIQPEQLWLQLQQIMVFPQPGIRGPLTFQSLFHGTPDAITLSETRVQSSDLQISSDGLRILPSEPVTSMAEGRVHLEGSGNAIRTLIAPWHTADWLAESSSVSMDIDADPRKQTHITASVQPGQVASVPRRRVKSVSRRVTGAVTPQLVLNEGNLDLLLEHSKTGDGFDIRSGVIRIPGVQSSVSGRVIVRGDDIILDLAADTQYDLEILSDRLMTQESPVMLRGTGRDVFRITGSPSRLAGPEIASIRMRSDGRTDSGVSIDGTGSARHISLNKTTSNAGSEPVVNSTGEIQPLRASGKLSWESGVLWGLTLGSGTLDALLENGVVRTQPIQCSISTGELNVVPRLDLVGERLQFGTGSRVQNIELTPELCREWLGYLAPLLAETADVSGLVSARVERFDYDLNGPENSDIAAVITIHQAKATPGPSLAPMLQGLELLRRKEKSQGILDGRALTLPSQEVAVQLSQGMVQHQGLKIEIAGYQAQTSGFVGLNRQLQLNLDLPLEKASATGTTRVSSVRIPIQGTIDQPHPDVSAMVQNLGTGAIQEKVDEVINNKLDDQLNKLFKKF